MSPTRWLVAMLFGLAGLLSHPSRSWSQDAAGEDRITTSWMEQDALLTTRLELDGRLEAAAPHCPNAPSQSSTWEPCEMFFVVAHAASEWGEQERRESRPAVSINERERVVYRLVLRPGASPTRFVKLPAPRSESERRFGPPRLSVQQEPGSARLLVSHLGRAYWLPLTTLNNGAVSPPEGAELTLPEPIAINDSEEWRWFSLPDPREAVVVSADIGALDVLAEVDGHWLRRHHRLPVQVRRNGDSLDLRSPDVHSLGTAPVLYAVGPEEHGRLRLRTTLLDPLAIDPSEAPEPAAATGYELPEVPENERWSKLPGIERVIASHYFSVDQRPMLMVVTLRADKIGFLERKKLRLYELARDRTRLGSEPIFATLTASRMWQTLGIDILDADADGTLDLVLVQPEGLSGNKLAIDLYRGRPGSSLLSFEAKSIRTLIQEPEGWWKYGLDWNGDGRADLLTLSDGELRGYRGRAPGKKGFLDLEPTLRHRIDAPTRTLAADGEQQEATPRLRVFEEQGIVWVRARYPDGPDLVEIVIPKEGPGSLSTATLRSEQFFDR